MNGGSNSYKPYIRVQWELLDAYIQVVLTDLGSLLRLAQNCKMHFFGQFKDITQVGNMETVQMTPFFDLIFLL